MAVELKVPALGESISSGILSAWHVSDGARVEEGQLLYELETDKITSEGHAEASGKIRLRAAEGDEVEVGQVVAEIYTEATGQDSESGDKEEGKEDSGSGAAEAESGADSSTENERPAEGQPLSPAVKKLASESGIDPATVKGSGKGGRVTKGDLQAAIDSRKQGKKPEGSGQERRDDTADTKEERAGDQTVWREPSQGEGSPAGSTEVGSRQQTRKRMTPLRRRIAERLVEAQQTAAMLTTFNEADLTAVMELRRKHQDAFVAKHGLKLGFMSLFVKAAVRALREVPNVGAQIEGDEMVFSNAYDIGVAVSTEKGLLVPVVRDCDQKSFAEIERVIADYAKKAREGRIGIDDLQGGIFTITNGGIFGSMLSTPILNTPQSGILGMHAIQQRPVAVEGEVQVRPMMYLALTYDHRLVDGREAVTFLVKIKESIEEPVRLLFDA